MKWQDICKKDPFLAGAIAAKEWEWYDETTAENEAASVGLTGEYLTTFLSGWQFELDERKQEEKQQRENKLVQFLDLCDRGYDPVEKFLIKPEDLP